MRSIPASALLACAVSALVPTAATAGVEDRYGPAEPAAAVQSAAPTTYLTWPGKGAAPSQAQPQPVQPPPAAASSPMRASSYRPASPAVASAYPVRARSAAAVQVNGPPIQQAAASGAPPRYYSLHREYGLKPDPISLTPQFLAQTGQADLAEPPPPPAPHVNANQTANMSSAAAAAQLRQAQDPGLAGGSDGD